jgi:1,2-diacylglycerol 3-beta-galactosyltransferase
LLRQRVLILMSNTGDGHRASAEALCSGFEHAFPGRFDIEIIDLLVDHLPQPLSQLPKTYATLTNHLPRLWQWMWNVGASQHVINPLAAAASWVVRNDLAQLFVDHRPDLVISVHPLIQHIALDALGQRALLDSDAQRIPFITVVTDLATAHPTWFHPKVDLCFVASQDARRQALICGVDPRSLYEYGVPVRHAFQERYGSREALRRELSLIPDSPMALIVGGGEGHGPIAEIAMRTADVLAGGHGSVGQLAVICGRNEGLWRRLDAHCWPVPTEVRGYVSNMDQWMHAADCMVTKAGPGTIAEAMVCGLPLVLSGFIPGQEAANVDHVVRGGAGLFSSRPDEIASIVAHWLGDGEAEMEVFAVNARLLGRPDATERIVTRIASFCDPRHSPTPSLSPQSFISAP